jgi:hypothetical protein
VAKVPGAVIIRLAAGATLLSVFQDTHAWIEKATDFWLRAFIRRIGCDFNYGAPLNFVWAEDAELDSENWLDLRVTTGGHL